MCLKPTPDLSLKKTQQKQTLQTKKKTLPLLVAPLSEAYLPHHPKA